VQHNVYVVNTAKHLLTASSVCGLQGLLATGPHNHKRT